MTKRVLRLYLRGDCQLCDDMKEQLKSVQDEMGFDFESHDIDRSEEMRIKFNEHVPILMWGRDVICYHQLDKPALTKALGI